MSADRVLQAAVLVALEADGAHAALVTGGVHDGTAPKATAFPYTLIGDTTTVGRHNHDGRGAEHTLTLHNWSDYDGSLECQQIAEAEEAVLHGALLTVTGWGLTKLIWEFDTVLTEYDDELETELRHGVRRYRCHSRES